MSRPIEDYAFIGDCRTAALVGCDGSIDWMCMPRFDSGACFAALLGDSENGRWLLAPASGERVERRSYRGDSLVLDSVFATDHGSVTVTDCMPPHNDRVDLVRSVSGRRGEVRMRMELVLRFDYGSITPWVRRVDGGISAIAGPERVELFSDVETRGEKFRTVAEFSVREGQTVSFVLSWHPSTEPRPSPLDAAEAIADSAAWWQSWADKCTHESPWNDAVMRSLVVLKALTYAPTGGIVAAATSSLPERLGGARNWDYRYCWMRDATFVLYALLCAGYEEEASAWREWLLRAVAGRPEQMQIMYGLAGERRLPEIELDWLSGYQGARPVRIGNAASGQHQLDVYGEVMDVLHVATRHGLERSENAWRVQQELLEFLETDWHEPDDGIWEMRGPRRHFTHSKVMAWVAMDRGIKAVERFGAEGPVERWRAVRREIHQQVCERGFDEQRGVFTQSYGCRELDASLLMIPLVGFLPPDDPRMRSTVAAIQRDLQVDGFVQRYRARSEIDGLSGGEGAFLLCSFWLADNLAMVGRRREACELFERLLDVRNDVGLLAEQYDPALGRQLGNFPQAFSHVALINTAFNLRHGGHRPLRPPLAP